MPSPIAIYGLTGGIGAGKSTVGAMLAAAGIEVVSSDMVARDVVSRGSDGLQAIIEAFGADLLDANGVLDRKRLAGLAFQDAGQRQRLENILHPMIRDRSRMLFAELQHQGVRLVVYESALLFESGRSAEVDEIVLVTADERVRIARICDRNQCTEREARSRIEAQRRIDDRVKREAAHYVIDNSGSLDRLQHDVEGLVSLLRSAAISPDRRNPPASRSER